MVKLLKFITRTRLVSIPACARHARALCTRVTKLLKSPPPDLPSSPLPVAQLALYRALEDICGATSVGRRLRSAVTQRTESAKMWSDHQCLGGNGPCRREKGGSPTSDLLEELWVCAPRAEVTRRRPAAPPERARYMASQATAVGATACAATSCACKLSIL